MHHHPAACPQAKERRVSITINQSTNNQSINQSINKTNKIQTQT